MKRILLTGASGKMGSASLRFFEKTNEDFTLTLFLRPTGKNKRFFRSLKDKRFVPFWGDLTSPADCARAAKGQDIILHPAAYISPKADEKPLYAWKVNLGGTKNLIKGIKENHQEGATAFVYISSVSVYGDRRAPVHLARTGDPLLPGVFDLYAVSKVRAEMAVAESGLSRWAVLRETMIAGGKNNPAPIMFYMQPETPFEVCLREDTGRLLAHAGLFDLPEGFWKEFYNIGGGPSCRTYGARFLHCNLKAMGLSLTKVTERRWFTLRNFHSVWFADSDKLESYLHFRSGSLEDYYKGMVQKAGILPFVMKKFPQRLIKALMMAPLALKKKASPGYWVKHNPQRLAAFYGSKEAYDTIPGWKAPLPTPFEEEPQSLSYGYDRGKPLEELSLEELSEAARFRGGKLLSKTLPTGSPGAPLSWECHQGHSFSLSPRTALKGGHWCPHCLPPESPWDYGHLAEKAPFYAQVWQGLHGQEKPMTFPADGWQDIASPEKGEPEV